jgi:hypothetical protein
LNRVTTAQAQPPFRQVRADYDDQSLVVYQAYSDEIADATLAAGRFVAPFKASRMTWIKPSFTWMMYRSGHAAKPGQERILAVRISRAKFDEALGDAVLSHFDQAVYPSYDEWVLKSKASAVRVQWDPERTVDLEPLGWRSIQIGLGDPISRRYASDWIVDIDDVTSQVKDVQALVLQRRLDDAAQWLRSQRPYPLPNLARRAVGASDWGF